jgi:hypothetical protein
VKYLKWYVLGVCALAALARALPLLGDAILWVATR